MDFNIKFIEIWIWSFYWRNIMGTFKGFWSKLDIIRAFRKKKFILRR